jgi:CHAT domain-containing protein
MRGQLDGWFQEGINAAKSGQRQRAYDLLSRVVEHDDQNLMAWLWCSTLEDNEWQRHIYHEKLLAGLAYRSKASTDENRLAQAIAKIIWSRDWAEIQRVVEANPALLKERSLDLLTDLSFLEENVESRQWINEVSYLLVHCCQIGVEAAFAQKMGRDVQIEFPEPKKQFVSRDVITTFEAVNRIISLPLFGMPADVPSEYESCVLHFQTLPDTYEILEEQIELSRLILDHLNQAESPDFWRFIKIYLGRLLACRVARDRSENLEQAIRHFSESLEVETRVDLPAVRGYIFYNLANAFYMRIHGDRTENLEMAITHCQTALDVFTRENFPVQWAAVQNSLGNIYQRLLCGNRTNNTEQAIQYYYQALKIYTQSAFPEQWAITQINLAQVFSDRMIGDRAENLEQAIHHCLQALNVYTFTNYPVQWADFHITLANAYQNRIRGERARNIEQTIHFLGRSLGVITYDSFPIQWGMVQNNLGMAFTNRLRGDRDDNLRKAIYHLQEALKARIRSDFPEDWASTQLNLAIAYSHLGDQEKASHHFNRALEIYTREDFPTDWAVVQYHWGNAYQGFQRSDRPGNIGIAAFHYRLAVDAFRDLGLLHLESIALQALCKIDCIVEAWGLAYTELREAISLVESIRSESIGEIGRTNVAEDSASLYNWMVETCLCLKPPHLEEAWEWAEAGKSRFFLDQLGHSEFPPPQGIQKALVDKESELMRDLRELSYEIQIAPNQAHRQLLAAALKHRHQELEEIWGKIETHQPYGRDYVALRRGDAISFARIKALVETRERDIALVALHYTLDNKVVRFVLRRGWGEPRVLSTPLDHQELFHGYWQNFFREVINYPYHIKDAGRESTHRWQKLGDLLFGDVMPLLEGAQLLYLIPHSIFHYLPLHALSVNGIPIIEEYPVAYVPSAAVLDRVQKRVEFRGQSVVDRKRILAVGFTPEHNEREHFEGEAKHIAGLLQTNPHLGTEAKSSLLQREGSLAQVIHLSCHGRFDRQSSMASFVRLSDGLFTADEVMKLNLQADLVTLSACETGQSDLGRADDPTGLPRAFLYAGASSLLVCMGEVYAPSTKTIMEHFYRRLYSEDGNKRMSKAEALREAILEVRDYHTNGDQPFADPYYWAPFFLIGHWR